MHAQSTTDASTTPIQEPLMTRLAMAHSNIAAISPMARTVPPTATTAQGPGISSWRADKRPSADLAASRTSRSFVAGKHGERAAARHERDETRATDGRAGPYFAMKQS